MISNHRQAFRLVIAIAAIIGVVVSLVTGQGIFALLFGITAVLALSVYFRGQNRGP